MGRRKFFIRCSSYQPNTSENHFFRWVTSDVDVGYLVDLFQDGLPDPGEEGQESDQCNVVEPMTSNLRTCGKGMRPFFKQILIGLGVDHPQGQGQIVRLRDCPVTFHVIIPNNLEQVPYFVLIVFGTHSHAPPPPFIVERDDILDIADILHPMLTPQTTRCRYT